MLKTSSRHQMGPRMLPGFCLLISSVPAEAVQGALPTLFLGTAADCSSLACSLPVPLAACVQASFQTIRWRRKT